MIVPDAVERINLEEDKGGPLWLLSGVVGRVSYVKRTTF